jgi:hypothetical protein
MYRSLAAQLITLCLIETIPCSSQYYFQTNKYYSTDIVVEMGASAGAMNCLSDLGGKKGVGKNSIKDLNWNVTKPSFSIYALLMYKDAIAVRLEGTLGSIQSYDSILQKDASTTYGRYERNLSFRSNITELHICAEIHPLFFKRYEENEAPYWSPYFLFGIGIFNFNPKAELNGFWYYLHPLRTEGQGFDEYTDRKPYKLTQINIPIGVGLKYELSAALSTRLEIVHRLLFTDYLDDVSTNYIDPTLFNLYLPPSQAAIARQLYDRRKNSTTKGAQRGSPSHNDAFFSIQLKLGIAFRKNARF